MVAITNTISLTFLKDEIEDTLNRAENSLESFVEDPGKRTELEATVEAFHQVHGIYQMLELPAAALMAEEMELVGRHLLDHGASDAGTAALSNAIVLMARYLEYVQLKNRTLPELLVGGINELRRATGKSLIPESHFFSVDLSRDRFPQPPASRTDKSEVPRLCRRLRHMYQVGLIGVLREQNSTTSLKLMSRALERVDRLCGPVGISRWLWIARGAVESMRRDNMRLTPGRKMLLSQYDRQLKKLVYDGDEGLSAKVPLLLIKEGLYLVSLSSRNDDVIGEIKQVYDLRGRFTDQALQEEVALMAGGGGSVVRTVAVGLKEELSEVTRTLDMAAQGAPDASFADVAEVMGRIANTLIMVGRAREAQKVKERANQVRHWQDGEVDPEGMDFQQLVDELLSVENVVAGLERQFAPQDDVHKEARNEKVSLYQLDDARMAVVGESRSGLTLTKRSISSFVDNNFDPMHLSNLPGVLAGVSGGLTFLELDRARAVLDACRNYIDQVLINGSDQPTQEQLETLADAVTSVDYYLESMEEQKPIGEAVLEVAEESMEELGFPVVRANPV
jgi:hypothetical protein